MKTVICKNCKTEQKHYAKGFCARCYQNIRVKELYGNNKKEKRNYQKEYYANNREKVKNYRKELYNKKKIEQDVFKGRLKRALKKAGHSENKIITFFGIA